MFRLIVDFRAVFALLMSASLSVPSHADDRVLPEAVREAAVRARASVPKIDPAPLDTTPLPPKFTAWAERFIASGELAKALQEAAAGDPDLVG